jgi:hypothetical protein
VEPDADLLAVADFYLCPEVVVLVNPNGKIIDRSSSSDFEGTNRFSYVIKRKFMLLSPFTPSSQGDVV